MRATSISCRADKRYVESLRLLAMKQGVDVADIVRAAIDASYADELKEIGDSFFGHDGASMQHNGTQQVKNIAAIGGD